MLLRLFSWSNFFFYCKLSKHFTKIYSVRSELCDYRLTESVSGCNSASHLNLNNLNILTWNVIQLKEKNNLVRTWNVLITIKAVDVFYINIRALVYWRGGRLITNYLNFDTPNHFLPLETRIYGIWICISVDSSEWAIIKYIMWSRVPI